MLVPLTILTWCFHTRFLKILKKNGQNQSQFKNAIDHQLKYSSPNRSKKRTKKRHTKEPTFRKMKVMGKRGQENGPKAEERQD